MQGKLSVKVTSANNLPNRELLGSMGNVSDPYTKVSFDGLEFRTSTVNSNLNPVWIDEAFTFEVDTVRQTGTLRLEVYDENTLRADKSLGFFELDISATVFHYKASQWKRRLTDGASGENGGEINFEISFLDHALDEKMLDVAIDVLQTYEVSDTSAEKLCILRNYDIEVIIDDSSSMRSTDGGILSRWDELKETLRDVLSVQCIFDEDGVGITSLNRGRLSGIKTIEDPKFKDFMEKQPCGSTPLTRTLKTLVDELIAKSKCENDGKNNVLLMIFTDGEPDGGIEKFTTLLESVLYDESSPIQFRCQIMACIGRDTKQLEWLNELDAKLNKLDVTDDYQTERKEVLKRKDTFTRGEWIIKALLGAVDENIDASDELSPEVDEPASKRFKGE
mmetsp:Transcript_91045/g.143810  ORF Transcript_91045/g.143810 Transcript_91045/m.143810 type:complete len:392 (-) Transcript_91045:191-1366(-)